MEKEEKIIKRLWSDPEFKPALLIGGLIFYVPIVNLLLFGYIALFMQKLFRREGLEVLSWREGTLIFKETIRVFPLVLVYFIIPLFVGGLLTVGLQSILYALHLGFFAKTIAFLPLTFLAVVLPVILYNAFKRFLKRDDLRTSLLVMEILQISLKQRRQWIKPLLMFWGWIMITWPLVGFGFFAGVLPLLAVVKIETEAKAG